MTAVIREDKIADAIQALNQYVAAAQPLNTDAPDFSPDEMAMIRKHRIDRARVALENIGIQIAQALGALASQSVPDLQKDPPLYSEPGTPIG